MFIVLSGLSLGRRTLMRSKDVHLESATYSWPWLNTGVRKSMPTYFTDCPWDLFMVRAYANRIGNWRLVIWNGNSEEDGVKDILGMKTKSPYFSPVIIWASIVNGLRASHLTTLNLVLLHRPIFGAIFLNKIIGHLTFNCS